MSLTPGGEGILQRINAMLAALEGDVVALEGEEALLGSINTDLARLRTRLEAEGRGAVVGQTGAARGAAQPSLIARSDASEGRARSFTAAEQGAARYEQAMVGVSSAETRAGATFQAMQARLAASNQEMRSYGALTTEYFASLNRGAGTIRGLGFQVTSTIQKFGGWLGAGAAVYGALGAVTAIGRGAIDSASGVNQLDRVINRSSRDSDAAQASFRSLALKFNLPIADVSEAAYQMGKVFHDQNDALKASESVLYAVKVGELDVASASRYLTAITQGFNLTAGEMPHVFDQINQAQNKYNISTQSVLAGTAKAAGSFRLAGGDVTHLIALITTLSKATGQTGDVIGTALQRSPHFINQDTNQAILAGYHVDTKQSIVKIYDEAIQAAKHLSSQKQRQLAEALFGPQYGARVGVALLQQGKLYSQVLQNVSPEASRNSAQRELNTTLGATSEQLSKVITELQVMGSELESAHFFDAFGGAVKLLDTMLNTANLLLEDFNKLPDPIVRTVSYLIQAAAVLKTLRFFNFGQRFAQGSLGNQLFTRQGFSGQEAQRRVIVGDYVATSEKQIGGDLQGSARRAARAQTALEVATRNQAAAQERAAIANRGLTVEEAAQTESGRAVVATEAKRIRATEALAEAELELKIVLQEAALTAKAREELARGVPAQTVNNRYLGGFAPTSVGRPSLTQSQILERRIAEIEGQGGPGVVPIGGGSAAAEAETRATSGSARNLGSRLEALAAEGGSLGIAGGIMARSSGAARAKIGGAVGRLKEVNLSALGTSMKNAVSGLAAAIGPLDIAIGAVLLLPPLLDAIMSRADEAQSNLDAGTGASPRGAAALRKQAQALQAAADSSAQDLSGTTLNPIEDAKRAYSDLTGASTRYDAANQQIQTIMGERSRLLYRLNEGLKVTSDQLSKGDAAKQISNYIAAFRRGDVNEEDFRREVSNLDYSIRKSLPTDQANKAVSAVHAAILRTHDLATKFSDFAGLSDQALAGDVTAYGAIVGGGTGVPGDTHRLVQVALEAARRGFQSTGQGPDALKVRQEAATALSTLVQSVTGAAQQNFNTNLAIAKGQHDRDAAYAKYIQSLDPGQITRVADRETASLKSQLQRADSQVRGLQGKVNSDQGLQSFASLFGKNNPIAKQLEDDKKALRGAQDNAKRLRDTIHAINKAANDAADQIKAARQQARQQRFQEDQSIFEARTAYQSSLLPAGTQRIGYQIKRIGDEIDRAIKVYGRDSSEVLNLLNQQAELRDQRVQEQVALVQSQGDLRAAGISQSTDPVAYAQAQLDTLQNVLAIEKAHPQSYKPSDLTSLEAQIRGAQTELAQTQVQQQADLIQAQNALQQSTINAEIHPIAAARATLDGLRRLLSYEKARPGQFSRKDIIELEAQVNQAQISLANAVYQQAKALRDGAYDIQIARAQAAGNTVLAAKREIAKTLYDLRQDRTPEERQQDRQALINERAQKEQAIFDTQLQDIQFQADIGKLTLTQQINAYQHLLDTMNLTKQQRQQLKQAIYSLKQQSDTDIAVGDIKLPTIYEIRRAIQGGVTSGPQTSVTINNKVQVDANGANADEVVQKLSNALQGSNSSSLRAAGLR